MIFIRTDDDCMCKYIMLRSEQKKKNTTISKSKKCAVYMYLYITDS